RMAVAESSALCAWVIPQNQRQFVDPIGEVLRDFGSQRAAYVAVERPSGDDTPREPNDDATSTPVAFFQIDPAPDEPPRPGYVAIRNFFVAPHAQGRGVGTNACRAAHALVRREYPTAKGICLTVNCRNRAAYRVYEKAGFVDTGELYVGGRSGPQHIMLVTFDR
ncbi:MAG: GNAT family N-acetyltransferase, partial [Pseudomonadota bacterium]